MVNFFEFCGMTLIKKAVAGIPANMEAVERVIETRADGSRCVVKMVNGKLVCSNRLCSSPECEKYACSDKLTCDSCETGNHDARVITTPASELRLLVFASGSAAARYST